MTITNPSDRDSEPYVEVGPTGRFGRYAELLVTGTVRIYRGFDQEEGIEIAWNQIHLYSSKDDSQFISRLFSQFRILSSLRHDHVLELYDAWLDADNGKLNFITEICTSGNLRQYRHRHRNVSLKAIKKWSRQILHGLAYLHSHPPFVFPRDINCANIFINGNIGQVKIGDLGIAAMVEEHRRKPSEVSNKDYTEKDDIYSFGMSILEMLSFEKLYKEGENVEKLAAALEKVKDPVARAFIEQCVGAPESRASAVELLRDPFFFSLDIADA